MSDKGTPTAAPAWAVRWIGAQREVLAGDVSGAIDLATLAHLPHLYALGPREGLLGEVSVFDGRPSVSRVVDDGIEVDATFEHRACFLAFATVAAWDEVTLAHPVDSVAMLEERLLETALGRRAAQPFPFRVTGRAKRLELHVLDKRDGLRHTPELHERAKVHFTVEAAAVEVVGFWSRWHRGIFTPRDSDLHMHVRTLDDRMSGHLEAIELAAGASLWLPPSGGRKDDGK